MGQDLGLEDARDAAMICANLALAWLDWHAGGLPNIERLLRMQCFVAHGDGFSEISDIADAACGRLIDYLGPHGRLSRSVLGVKSLPRNSPVLIEVTAALIGPVGQNTG